MTPTHLLKCRSLTDFYKEYPYRKNPEFTGTIPLPYVKKEEESTHKYSLTFQEWKSILESIVEEIFVQILSVGLTWNIGSNLGSITIRKHKCKTFLDKIESGKQGKQVRKLRNKHDNYMLFAVWERKKYALKHKWLWRFYLTDKVLRRMYLMCESDYTYIYKFQDK